MAKLGPDEPTKALPPDFDKSLVNYPDALIEHVRRPRGAMREILFSTSASFDQLIDYYKEALKKGGFQVTSSLRIAARHSWSCDFHKSGRQASLMLYPSDKDKSRFTIDLIYEMPSRTNEALTVPEETFDVVGPGEVAQQSTDQGEKRN